MENEPRKDIVTIAIDIINQIEKTEGRQKFELLKRLEQIAEETEKMIAGFNSERLNNKNSHSGYYDALVETIKNLERLNAKMKETLTQNNTHV